jgi:hypothetical protein
MTAAQPAAKTQTNSPAAPFAAAGTGAGLAFRCRGLAIDVGDERRRIIAGLDLEVPRRQFLCILGESGVGKTTLLRVFGGLAPAAPGSILELNGQPIVGPPDGAVFVFQNYAASLRPGGTSSLASKPAWRHRSARRALWRHWSWSGLRIAPTITRGNSPAGCSSASSSRGRSLSNPSCC